MNDNYNFNGAIPPDASIADNIFRALQYQSTHTPEETFDWFYEQVRNNSDGHLLKNGVLRKWQHLHRLSNHTCSR